MLEWDLLFTSGIYATTTSPCDAAAEEGIVAVPAKC
jgi:hypothetical protein